MATLCTSGFPNHIPEGKRRQKEKDKRNFTGARLQNPALCHCRTTLYVIFACVCEVCVCGGGGEVEREG